MTLRTLRSTLCLALAAATIVLGLPAASHALTNLVPNPGFEQGGCGGSTPVICGWESTSGDPEFAFMGQDTFNPHSGGASMALSGSYWASASTDPAFCAAIGPGAHPASFWYSADGGVSFGAYFYDTADCTGTSSFRSLSAGQSNLWQQRTGVLVAPPGTQSALFELDVSFGGGACNDPCLVGANFDDVDVEDAVVTTPVINSFPPSGPVGSSVVIDGANFTGATSVTFNGTEASFTVDSDREIHATVPNGATTGPISVTTPNGTDTSSTVFTVLPPLPTISSFTPTSGPAGTSVDIRGSNFTGAAFVQFANSGQTTFTVDSDSEIHAIVPDSAMTGPISVITPSGTGTSSSAFRATPTISSFTPTSGPVGTYVTIRGTAFTAFTSVTFNGTAASSFFVDSPTYITAYVPTGATTGPISVTTADGTATSSSSFTVVSSPPTISSFSPTSGPVGTSVDVHGTNFTGATSVKFNGTAAVNYTVDSDLELHATVPGGATTGPISVTTLGGTATSSSSFTVTVPPPSISSFAPTSGPVGTTVTITGNTFSGASSVTFNGAAATSFTFVSSTTIASTVPVGATSGPISVTTPGGTATSAGSFTVTAPLPPEITSFSPKVGHTGQQVTITGSNFTGATSVRLGTSAAEFTVNSGTSITATVPLIRRGYYKWSVTNAAGTATSTTSFHVVSSQVLMDRP